MNVKEMKKLVKVFRKDQYGISQGKRMVGIVKAKTATEAKKKAHLLPMYDYWDMGGIKAWKYFEYEWK